ncbi:MAG: methyltransferase domain-containing protein [Candidatus Diapherotrites archaeon]|nr:methyltransferase domain-containing protein [Candidatus Diapherotrites archaeon]
MKRKKSWHVKSLRPEELYIKPEKFYTREEIERYAKCNAMRKAQQRLVARLIELMGIKPPLKVLDLGCGVGYSTEYLQSAGFEVIALDLLEEMVRVARNRGLNAIAGDMRELQKYFAKQAFDAIVSVSALQWISKSPKDVKAFCFATHYVLKQNGKIGLQFYPQSEPELMRVADIMSKRFSIEVIVDNPKNPRKRVLYIIGAKKEN